MSPQKRRKGPGRPRLLRPEPEPEASLDESEMMTLADVAEYLNCHYSTAIRLVRNGDFPAFRLGGSGDYRCRRSDLEKWIAERQAEPYAVRKHRNRGRKPKS